MYGISGGYPGLHPRNTWSTIALTFKLAPKITENVSQQHYVMTWIPIFRNLVGLRINVTLKVAESLWWLADLKPASSGPPYSVTAPRWQCYRSSWGPRPVDALWVPSRLLPGFVVHRCSQHVSLQTDTCLVSYCCITSSHFILRFTLNCIHTEGVFSHHAY